MRKKIDLFKSSFLLMTMPNKVKPTEAGLLVTENCMLKCQTCTYWKNKKIDLSLDKIKYIIDKLKKFGIKEIVFTGGEPLIRKDMKNIVDYAKRKKMYLIMITNAWLYANKKDVFNNIDAINISIDGPEEIHDKIRGVKGSFKRTVNAAKDLKKRGKVVRINFVVQKDNYKKVDYMIKLAKSIKSELVIFCVSFGGMGQIEYESEIRNMEPLFLKKLGRNVIQKEFFKMIAKKIISPRKQKCIAPYVKFMIDGDGNLHPCSAWPSSVGNLLKEDLGDIWKRYQKLRERIRKGEHKICKDCYSCELVDNFLVNPKVISKYVIETIVNAILSR